MKSKTRIQQISAPFNCKVERASKDCFHISTNCREESIYELAGRLYQEGFTPLCYQTSDRSLPVLGVFTAK